MNTKHLKSALCLTAMTALASPALAASSATGNLGVAAVVADTCIIAAGTAMSFATINTGAVSNQVTPGVVTVTCTATRPSVTVTLGGGENESSGARRMISSTGDFLPYNVFSDSGHASQIGVDGTLYDQGITAAVPQAIPVYGQIPVGSYNAGVYSDTLLVTLTY